MGHWNHRVVRRVYPNDGEGYVEYAVHEAFYGLDGDNKPSITEEPDSPHGETLEELREDLQRMLRVLDAPVLDYETREEIK